MPVDTEAVLTVEILLNITRGSLGGFYIPLDVVTGSKSHEDNMSRFTFTVNTLKVIKNPDISCPQRNSRYR